MAKNLKNYLASIDGHPGDVCADIYYCFLNSSEHAAVNLQVFLENWFDTSKDHATAVKCYYTSGEYEECYRDIKPIMDRLLSKLIEKNDTPDVFYRNLWNKINNDALFETDIEKITAILFLLLSSKIPYFQMGNAVQMSEEEFQQIGEEVKQCFRKAVFALNRGYEQQTEVASQILNILQEIPEQRKQIVFISKLIGLSYLRIAKLERQCEQLKTDL